ncbi:glycosyltransferase [Brachybacterium tyrofermentans]|uniref:glycosyltransferase n=1 Tax=Brachybacterium tyrofermentans TaxID=47848 RepID=UPI003FD34F8D
MSNDQNRSFEYRRFRRMGSKVDVWALSSESGVAKDIFAAIASDGERGFTELQASVTEGTLDGWNPEWVARLARVLVLQPHESEFHGFALDALRLTVPTLHRTAALLPVRKIYFELLFASGELGEARELLESDNALSELYYGYLGTDLLNPFVTGSWEAEARWLEGFNVPFATAGLSPAAIDRDASTPFDGLRSDAELAVVEGPLVSVIVTTYNPDPVEIRTSVTSILQQTWKNLEVLLMDDHSDEAALAALGELAAEDPRVKLLRLPENGGTYRARNEGIRNAAGKYVTGQDTDDWSHPERIARQVSALEADSEVPGVTTAANRTDDRLVRVSLGNNPHRRCEVSLMLRVETARKVGGYLPVRKAADSEFRERLEAWWGASVQVLDEPLYIIRMSPGSLSRADFRPGWSHHARRGFWSAYKNWHATAESSELEIDASDPELAIPATTPPRIAGKEWARDHSYDLCLVADWRGGTPEQRAAVDELKSLVNTDLSIALLHFDTPWGAGSLAPRALVPDVQRLITDGKVRRVYAEEEVEVAVVVVRDPAAVDYARQMSGSLVAGRVLMVAHSNPAGRDVVVRKYDPHHAHEMAGDIFGVDPLWMVPTGEDRELFQSTFELPVATESFPMVVDMQRFSGVRLRRAGGRLVLGRSADNEVEDWPTLEALHTTFPTDGSVEVRVLGDARGALRVSGERRLPPDWLSFREGEILPEIFWRTVDASVIYDQETRGRAIERPVLEALASGTPVITDSARAALYNHAVLVAEPADAVRVATDLIADRVRREEAAELGRSFVRDNFDPQVFYKFMRHCVSGTPAGAEKNV